VVGGERCWRRDELAVGEEEQALGDVARELVVDEQQVVPAGDLAQGGQPNLGYAQAEEIVVVVRCK
jgi:hypothetical protein